MRYNPLTGKRVMSDAYESKMEELIEQGVPEALAEAIAGRVAEEALADYGDWLRDQERDRRMEDG